MIMENRKRAYNTPEVEKIEFDFREQVVASGGIVDPRKGLNPVWPPAAH